jgi:hypothetical protein
MPLRGRQRGEPPSLTFIRYTDDIDDRPNTAAVSVVAFRRSTGTDPASVSSYDLRIFPDLRVDPRVTLLAGCSVFALHHAQEESGDR